MQEISNPSTRPGGSQEGIRPNNCMCCHTEIRGADQRDRWWEGRGGWKGEGGVPIPAPDPVDLRNVPAQTTACVAALTSELQIKFDISSTHMHCFNRNLQEMGLSKCCNVLWSRHWTLTQWPASRHDEHITHAIILTSSMSLQKRWSLEWAAPTGTQPCSLRLQQLLWIYCPGHAGVSGNERADRLASTADITSGLQLGRAEVLRGLRNFLSTDKPEHHSTDRLKERGVEKGSRRHSTLQGRERSVFNQTNIGTVSRATLGRLLRDRAVCIWAFSSTKTLSCAESETETDTDRINPALYRKKQPNRLFEPFSQGQE